MTQLAINSKSPHIQLVDQEGNSQKPLSSKSKWLIIYFYPKDNTEGCTIEAQEFSKYEEEFKKLDAQIFGISGLDFKSKKRFCESKSLTIPLLSDEDFSVSKSFGAYGKKSFMGKEYQGILRTTFIINKERLISHIFENVSPKGHAAEVLNWIKQHSKNK